MSEILSQSEIDKLLKAINDGDSEYPVLSQNQETSAVKDYNFARPSKFNKEQLHTLDIIFDNYSRKLSSFLTGYLRATCIVEVANSEQMTYKEFNNSLINPVVLGIVDFNPLKGSIVLELSADLGFSIIDKILGGSGQGLKKLRDFSEIEKILLERLFTQILTFLPETWENIVKLKPRLDKIETNSQFAQIISPNEMIALVTLSIKVGPAEGLLNFCIPHLVIEPVMNRLYTKFWFEQNFSNEAEEEYRGDLETQLEKTFISVCAVVGKTNISVSDFVNLQTGDIIPLDSFISSDLDIIVGGKLKFFGKAGINRGKNAIQITSLVDKEE